MAERNNNPVRRRPLLYAALAAVTAVTVVLGVLAWQNPGGSGDEPKAGKTPQSGPAGTAPQADFDRDGHADLAASSDFTDHVAVTYGGDGDKRRGQRLSLDSPGVPGKQQRGVSFGDNPVTGDFDGDGYTDLAVDVSSSRKKNRTARGGVMFVWGSPDGLRDGTYVQGVPRGFDLNGNGPHTLTAADFDGDRHVDLLWKVSGERALLKGPFTRDGDPSGTDDVPAPAARKDADLIQTLAADLDGDGVAELMSVHGYTEDDMTGGVTTSYLPSGKDGFGKPEKDRLPGISTATTGDVDKDGYPDLIMHRHPENSPPDGGTPGPVEVFHGSGDGPEKSPRTRIDRGTEGVPGKKEEPDSFGSALDAGDVDGDGYADVVTGDSGENLTATGEVKDGKTAGAVYLLRGGKDGLTGEKTQRVDQTTVDRPEKPGQDGFGDAVRLLDDNGDRKADLAVLAPKEDQVGRLRLLTGTRDGLTGKGGCSLGPEDHDVPRERAKKDVGFATRLVR
ncbi:FG-GAP and VCBS repeat-containing protein [Streptomyces sp. NPDC005438]|uniref:FG-GAP and VCBS repeat-containing protein n=1 Tax=Streptomyces sp. NPDC005438 TaxID=3156880 RepID=UPI0033A1E8C2